ncbi:type VI secretion system baseplate subunit TssG [Hafnia paralvei]|uniref:type VI secretion system baseplate subunit TssG n=1 Tax=Hafnia paralvei TaxID=546367 RepID=UPI001D106F88|nr:type VI secretion system baseplate subunit TssG [Hafnia paralvei]
MNLMCKFNFYQQIRLLLRRFRDGSTSDATLLDEKINLKSTLSLSSPDGEVQSITEDTNSKVNVTAWYNGLTGSMGALPTSYSEWMIERYYRYGDCSAKAFIDIFGHRLYCLDYLAWQKNHLYALAEAENKTPLFNVMLSMTGLLNSSNLLTLPRHLSLFAAPIRTMVNLEQWLTQRFNTEVSVIPFTGGWHSVDKKYCCILGDSIRTLGDAPMLGKNYIALDSEFEVELGPMSAEFSHKFLKNGDLSNDLWNSIRNYVGPLINFSITLLITSIELDIYPLGKQTLGYDCCIGTEKKIHPSKTRLSEPKINRK